MGKRYASLTHIEHNRSVEKATDSRFLHELKLGLLLALRERGFLTDMQLRFALEQLGDAG